MLRKSFFAISTVAVLAVTAFMLSAQPPAGGGGGGKGGPGGGGGGKGKAAPPAIVQIKAGLYEITGLGGNISVRVGTDGVFVADTGNLGQPNYDQILELIKTVTPLPIKGAAVTHVHQDHSGNTGLFAAAGVPVWAHQNEKAELATYTAAQGKPAEPNNTYAKDQNINLAGAPVQLHYYGATHTGGDTIVYFPDLKVVHGGDMIVGTAPNCDFANGGSVVSWAKVMDEVAKLDFDTVIPGHGNVMTKAQFTEYAQKWKTFAQRAIDEVKKGTPKEGLLAAIKVDDLGWNTGSYTARLDPFYAELQAAAK